MKNSIHVRSLAVRCGLPLSIMLCAAVHAQQEDSFGAAPQQPVELHGQATYLWQSKPAFTALYSGANSLSTEREKSYTFSATGFLGLRVWTGGEIYLDGEVIQGVPLSDLHGLGSPTNGEIQKVAGPTPKAYLPRAFLRQTWALGEETEKVNSEQHQLSGLRPKDRFVVTAGKLAVTDIFDQNIYSHDCRSQFLTWASLAQGAFDYVADAQGYSWGAAAEWYQGDWTVRAGRFIGPTESNGEQLNFAMARFHGDQVELEHRHELAGRPGAVRLLWWRNVENMGRFDDALAARDGGIPDVGVVRRTNPKHGYGLHWEQAVAADVGAFVRYSWNDGQTEAYSFEEVERSAQAGVQIKGSAWKRDNDTVGVLFIRNGLSQAHQQYLDLGGLGFFIGDGRLTYRPEQIAEAYYNFAVTSYAWIGADVQRIVNPAYNADRGPVNVYSVRLHAEF